MRAFSNNPEKIVQLLFIVIGIAITCQSCGTNDDADAQGSETQKIKKSPPSELDSTSLEESMITLQTEIAKYQRAAVWPGGTPEYGCYTWNDRNYFIRQGILQVILNQAKANYKFMGGVLSFTASKKRERLDSYNKWSEPIFPTWATSII